VEVYDFLKDEGEEGYFKPVGWRYLALQSMEAEESN